MKHENDHTQVKNQTTVVLLSYGDRWESLETIVSRLLKMGVGHVLIVTNAASVRTAEVVNDLVSARDRVSRLDYPENRGSAGGYAEGIRETMRNDTIQFYWLLDDDNLPEPDCLDRMFAAWNRIRQSEEGAVPVLVPARPDQGAYAMRLLGGVPWSKVSQRPSSFYGFHLLHFTRYLKQIWTGKLGEMPQENEPFVPRPVAIPVGNGYYGGMLLPREIVDMIGLPDERFFIYGDDTEYSFRIRGTTSMYLIGDAVVHDLKPSWYVATPGNQYARALVADDPVRVYYHVRNRVWVDRYVRGGSHFVYCLNRFCVRLIFTYYRLRGVGTPGRHRLIRRAIREGDTGSLGKREHIREE